MKMSEKFVKPERRVVFATICAAALALPLFAEQIVPGDYEKVFNIKFVGYKGTTTLTNFPALVRLSVTLNDFKYSVCKLENGGDVRFADADGNLLASEVDTWVPNGESLVWVKVPEFNRNTLIKVYYGNANPPTVTASDVWANGYVGVWHMNAPSDSVTQNDSTVNPINVTKARSDNDYQDGSQPGVDGRIGKAAEFRLRSDGKGGYFGKDPTGKLDGFPSITVEAWACQKAAATTEYNTLFAKRAGDGTGNNNRSFAMRLEAAKMIPCLYYYSRVDEETVELNMWPGSTTAELNKWCYHALRYDGAGGNKAYYSDATEIASWTSSTYKGTLNSLVNGDFFIGNWDDQWCALAFPGVIDEVRISNVARSKDWLMASHDIVDNDDFVSYEMENDWEKYSHKFTVSFTGFAGSTTLADFPALVKISESGISGFRYADCLRPDGADLRFSDAEGSLLNHEIEEWNTNGVSLVWVKVPSLNASTKITAYYGWNFAPSADPKAVWSNGYLGVWHMDEDNAATQLNDSTLNNGSFVRSSNHPDGMTNGVAGIVGNSVKFNGGDSMGQYALADKTGKMDGLEAMTVEAWAWQDDHEATENSRARYFLRKYDGTSTSRTSWQLAEGTSNQGSQWRGRFSFTFYLEGESDVYKDIWVSDTATKPARAEWNHSVSVWDGVAGIRNSFLNGSQLTSNGEDNSYKGRMIQVTGSSAVVCLGNNWNGGTYQFPGKIDEVRISNVARSADWIKATYDTIKNNSTFATYSSAREQVKGLMIIFR